MPTVASLKKFYSFLSIKGAFKQFSITLSISYGDSLCPICLVYEFDRSQNVQFLTHCTFKTINNIAFI